MRSTLDPHVAYVRPSLGVLAVAAGLFAVYANAVPLQYHGQSLADTWSRFQEIPWLQLGLKRRADWVANGLMLVPFGFFAAGFLSWRVRSYASHVLSFSLLSVTQGVFVCLIEFMQIWFPPRVLSQNDMLAGYLGGIFGILLWHAVGNRAVQVAFDFANSERGFPRIAILAECCALGLLLYGLMPFDFMLSTAEWQQKVEAGRFTWVPFSDWEGVRSAIKSVILCGWSVPLGVVLGLKSSDGRSAPFRLVAWCIAIEAVTIPIFGRESSTTAVVVPIFLGYAGIVVADRVLRLLHRLDHASVWLIGAFSWTILLVVGFASRFERLVRDRQELVSRLWGILAVPFARAQRSTEFQAAENILLKLLLFGTLGFLLAGWYGRRSNPRRCPSIWRILVGASWVASVGLAIEISQAFLFPLVPDITDLLLYGVGAILGMMAFTMLIPEHPSPDCGQRLSMDSSSACENL